MVLLCLGLLWEILKDRRKGTFAFQHQSLLSAAGETESERPKKVTEETVWSLDTNSECLTSHLLCPKPSFVNFDWGGESFSFFLLRISTEASILFGF